MAERAPRRPKLELRVQEPPAAKPKPQQPAPHILELVMRLAARDGVSNLAARPGCWERRFGEFSVSVHGQSKPVKNSHGVDVPAAHFFFWWEKGELPVGLMAPNGEGTMLMDAERDVRAALLRELGHG